MIERITKNWKTTSFALLIFAILGIVLYKDYATFQEASGWAALALTQLFSKDAT